MKFSRWEIPVYPGMNICLCTFTLPYCTNVLMIQSLITQSQKHTLPPSNYEYKNESQSGREQNCWELWINQWLNPRTCSVCKAAGSVGSEGDRPWKESMERVFIQEALSELLLAQQVPSCLCHRSCWRAGLNPTGDYVVKDSDAPIPAAQTTGILTLEWAASPSSAWKWRYEWLALGCLQGKGEDQASLGRDSSQHRWLGEVREWHRCPFHWLNMEHRWSAETCSASERSQCRKMDPTLPKFVTYYFYRIIFKFPSGDAILSVCSMPTNWSWRL